jgi:hypothetical protein
MATAIRRRGRPPKFQQRGRPITVTLPESTLAHLAAIDPDRSRAIVKAADAAMSSHHQDGVSLPELVEVAPGIRVILVGPTRCLRRIEWLRLFEVAPFRFLLIIPSGTSVDSLELAVIDLLENLPDDDPGERETLEKLRRLIGSLRRGAEVSKAEVLLVEKTTA